MLTHIALKGKIMTANGWKCALHILFEQFKPFEKIWGRPLWKKSWLEHWNYVEVYASPNQYKFMPARISTSLCQPESIQVYASPNQYKFMPARISTSLCQPESVQVYASPNQYKFMPARINTSLCQPESVQVYASLNQYKFMPAWINTSLCQPESVQVYASPNQYKFMPARINTSLHKPNQHNFTLQINVLLELTDLDSAEEGESETCTSNANFLKSINKPYERDTFTVE
jgi:hypothetical protein